MVAHIEREGVRDQRTLAALRTVPRHEFVPEKDRSRAYGDHPLPIGHGQTISQPYIVGFMTELLRPRPGIKVLEVGTGSGYQTALLAELSFNVFSVEKLRMLSRKARSLLDQLDYVIKKLRVQRRRRLDHAHQSNLAKIITKHAPHHLVKDAGQ